MKQIIIVVPDGSVNLSSITGTLEILSYANEYWQKMGNKAMIEICVASYSTELKVSSGFFLINPVDLNEIKNADLVIIPSISYDYDNILKDNKELIKWIRTQYIGGSEIASICTGVFLLAATGLLEGKTCSTHWNAERDFKRIFPNIRLEVDKLITAERGIYTNGGAYSFLNMVLFLVEKYFDRQTAIFCSKVFEIDIERTSQSPFIIFEAQKDHGDKMVGEAQTYIEQNLSKKFSFEELASRLAVTRRSFDRRFIKATGNTPVEYLQRVKVEVAKSTLEKGRKSVFEVMNDVGYSDDKAFREVFKRITGMSPLEYRGKYNKEAAR